MRETPLWILLVCRRSYWDSSAGVFSKHCGKLDFVKNFSGILFTRQTVLSGKQGVAPYGACSLRESIQGSTKELFISGQRVANARKGPDSCCHPEILACFSQFPQMLVCPVRETTYTHHEGKELRDAVPLSARTSDTATSNTKTTCRGWRATSCIRPIRDLQVFLVLMSDPGHVPGFFIVYERPIFNIFPPRYSRVLQCVGEYNTFGK